MVDHDGDLGSAQRTHWQHTYSAHPHMYGAEPSEPGRYAVELFRRAGAQDVLELGCGHGRDTLALLHAGVTVHALDFSATALGQLREHAAAAGWAEQLTTVLHDVRNQLPYRDVSFDAIYAHLLLCMALTTPELETVVGEVARVLRASGLFVYTVRHTGDAHYGIGVPHGDDMWEHGGFIVHFFDRALVDRLAAGWRLLEVTDLEEGELPRRLWRITLRKPTG